MKDYNLEIVDAAFVAAGWAQHGKALLYRFHPDQKRNDQFFNDYGLEGTRYPVLPSSTGTGSRAISLAEDKWAKSEDYWLGRYTLTDLVVKVPNKGVLLINDATVSINKQKQIVKTALVGRKGTIKEYITDGDYQISISIGLIAVDSNNEIIDQYPEKAMGVLREILEVDSALEVSSVFLDLFGVNRMVVTGFSAKQMTYANRQVVEVSAISDDDYVIQSTDY